MLSHHHNSANDKDHAKNEKEKCCQFVCSLCHPERWMHRVGLKRLPAQAPLRTVRESFPSHGSSLSKISLCRGDPAIRFLCTSILSCHRIPAGCECTGFSNGIRSPGETSPLLKILDILRLVGIGFSPNLDVALDHGPRHGIRAEDAPSPLAV